MKYGVAREISTALHYIEMMEKAGEHAAYLATLEPREGQMLAETSARVAYHYMRLAGLSPFDNNLNLNIGRPDGDEMEEA